MTSLRFTLCADGSSDDMLIPVIHWALQQHLPDDVPINPQFARWFDVRYRIEETGLPEHIRVSLDLFPCDLLVVHRDPETETRTKRVEEITEAIRELEGAGVTVPPHVCLVPLRMSEAWLLFDEVAIREAAGNPKGTVRLALPKPKEIERLADPKTVLRDAVLAATELTGRKRQKFATNGLPRIVANSISDFSPLRYLSAFQAFEEEIQAFAESWCPED